MDGENLELEDTAFDAVISRLGLMYFPDLRRSLSEIRRVLKPGGRVSVIVFSTAERSPFLLHPRVCNSPPCPTAAAITRSARPLQLRCAWCPGGSSAGGRL